jgi:iron complex outermembrane receptor protein
MNCSLRILAIAWTIVLVPGTLIGQMNSGTIKGKVLDKSTREPIPAANVLVEGSTTGASTDADGLFEVKGLMPGTYNLLISLVGYETTRRSDLRLEEGGLLNLEVLLAQRAVELGEVSVFGASLKKERITDAPSAVSVLEARDLKLRSGSAQAPKLLEKETGVDIVQSGLYDFNINTRGFNSSLNRRLLVLLDGRDLAIAFLSSQEWNGLSVPVEDFARLELVRGPASALYGANAFNGVINIQSAPPRSVQGTKVTFAGGEWSSARVDVRHAGTSGPWSYKANVGRFQGKSWHVSRKNLQFEYDGFSLLNNEEVDPVRDDVASTYGSARVDYDLDEKQTSTLEGGITQTQGEIFITGIGRVQVPKALKPWGRISYSGPSLYVQLWGAGRDSQEPQVSLSSGLPLIERSFLSQGEVQYRTQLFTPELFFIGGVSARFQTVNTQRTLMREDRSDNAQGAYGQLEYQASEELRFVVASRWDKSTLHSDQVSPKAAVVWSPSRDHSVRLTVNKAFQSPNLSELYLFILRTTTSPLNPNIRSHSAFHGNSSLKVERITGYELGYKGILTPDLFVTVDAYLNVIKDFITDLTPGVHPQYPQPAVLPDDPNGFVRTIWSYTNAGKVREGGIETSVRYYLGDSWVFDANHAYFGFSILESGVSESDLLPNAPEHKVNGGVTFRSAEYEVGGTIKYIPSFDWAAGIFKGKIPTYTLVDVAGIYRIDDVFEAGLTVTNVFNRKHYEIFGGSFIYRRAIVSITAQF